MVAPNFYGVHKIKIIQAGKLLQRYVVHVAVLLTSPNP